MLPSLLAAVGEIRLHGRNSEVLHALLVPHSHSLDHLVYGAKLL